MLHPLWSRPFDIHANTSMLLHLGPLVLLLERTETEWRIAHIHTDPSLPNTEPELSQNLSTDDLQNHPLFTPELASVTPKRFGLPHTSHALTLIPALADRPVVVRPSDTIHLLPAQHMTLFVSTPLWVRILIETSPNAEIQLHELPTWRPSDTWFGTPLEGNLCYASTTQGRRDMDDTILRPHRAITTVHIQNRSAETLIVDRINIPVVHLSLYTSPSNPLLWTEDVTITHTSALIPAHVELSSSNPKDTHPTPLSPPRLPTTRNFAQRVFGSLSVLRLHE